MKTGGLFFNLAQQKSQKSKSSCSIIVLNHSMMDDEIEAFMSVYAEDALLDSLPPPQTDGFEHNLVVTVRQRGALDAASSFVEANVVILLPVTYPHTSFPTVTVTRVSGLNDEGRELNQQISRFFRQGEQVILGDDVLFPLMEVILDCLDAADDGECLICLSSLLVNPSPNPNQQNNKNNNKGKGKKPCALRTTCYHCFHVHCLTRWGAMHTSQQFLMAEGGRDDTSEGRAWRAMQVRTW